MINENYEKAKQYVFERMERELSPKLVYHSIVHTRDEVLPAVEELAALEGVSDDEDLLLLRTAALYHDIGFIETHHDHEDASIRIAAEILPQFEYSQQQIESIQDLIRATKIPQCTELHLAMLLADADLDILGRENFFQRNRDLYLESQALGMTIKLEDWYRSQLRFLRSHLYFTRSAQSLRKPGKQRNIEEMEELLAGLPASEFSDSPVSSGTGENSSEMLK